MSASPLSRLFAALALVLAVGCGDDSVGGSTLPGRASPANPTTAPTPSDLAAFVEERARTLAAEPYRAPAAELPGALAELDYDAYRSIRFDPDSAVWRDAGRFQIQLFHPGFLFDEPVAVSLVDDSVRTLPFDPRYFRYEGAAEELAPEMRRIAASGGIGWAGFRVHYPLNAPDRMDEVAVFQGASYLRLVGPGQVYGLSARGLAVDVASDRPEEFPDFRAFWLERPAPDADTLVFHALLDSPSLTGAYRFVLAPGTDTELRVDARIFARTDVRKLGVAPLSSMFLFDEDLAGAFDDFRAGVHDSDGLLMRTRKDEWIWRPLENLRGLRVSSLRDIDPRGFGLAQRARDFDRYLDLEARYERRPSAWIRVHEEDRWGEGGVELLEIPTESEFNDNIAAYWVPSEPFPAGAFRRYRYTISTFDERLEEQTLGQVIRTRSGRAALPGAADADDSVRRFVVDFAGGPLDTLADGAPVQTVVETLAGRIDDVRAEPLPADGGWRASFRLRVEGDRPPDMRLYLESDGTRLTETWTYVWYPRSDR